MAVSSSRMRELWADPEWRAKTMAARNSPEAKRKESESKRRNWADPEYRARQSLSMQRAESDRFIDKDGYVKLRRQGGHPLAGSNGELMEHRKVLYDKLGPGPHSCHWCGKMMDWPGGMGIHADHLDEDRQNNDPENLVPSCKKCNGDRGKKKAS